jgi:hypothetical protein
MKVMLAEIADKVSAIDWTQFKERSMKERQEIRVMQPSCTCCPLHGQRY